MIECIVVVVVGIVLFALAIGVGLLAVPILFVIVWGVVVIAMTILQLIWFLFLEVVCMVWPGICPEDEAEIQVKSES